MSKEPAERVRLNMKKSTEKLIYFDNSATTFIKPDAVYERIIDVMKNAGGNAGRGGHKLANAASDVIFDTRLKVCDLFNIKSPSGVCFVSNASMGLNFAIKGILKSGDHVIMSPFEHNSVIRPVHKLSQNGVTYTVAPCDKNGFFEDLENLIIPQTKMIIVNHVSNVTGRIADIEKIGHIANKYGLVFLVDASQSAGHTEIDVEKSFIDVLVCSGHKGLFGPQGTGIMYLNEKIKTDTVFEGGSGSMSELLTQPENLPDRFETGTLNAPGIGGLCEGIKFLKDVGIENISAHEKRLADMLIRGLKTIKNVTVYSDNSVIPMTGVVGFNINGLDSVEAANVLSEKYNIMVRGGLHCSMIAHRTIGTVEKGCIRVSFSCFNTENEVKKLLNIIDILSGFDVY